jgi:alpha-1,6-mannosyltransferase
MPTVPLTLRGGVTSSTTVIAAVGFLGSALVARASYAVGTLPGGHIDADVATGPYRWVFEIGVGLLIVAWLALGRLVLAGAIPAMARRLWWTGAAMAAPLLVSAPVTSQDVWAYLGQANVAAHGLDPYSVGPGAVPGPYADAVATAWVQFPSPYGPLWLWICRLVVDVSQPHPWAGMFLLRALALVGVAATGVAVARLARRTGARPEVGLWLVLTGPFPLLMLLGAVHNDSAMLPLLVGGVAMAASERSLGRALVVGGVLIGVAASVKVTALFVLPFLPLVWCRYAADARRDPPIDALTTRRWLVNGAAACAVGVATVLVLGLVTGFGTGWWSMVDDAKVGMRWLSVPQQVANVFHLLDPDLVPNGSKARYPLAHAIGTVFLVVSLVATTITARTRPPLRTMAIVLLLVVVSSPAPRTWYLLWPLVFLAADKISPPLLVAVAAASASLALWYPPSVQPAVSPWLLLVVFGVLWTVTAQVLRPAELREPTLPPPLVRR